MSATGAAASAGKQRQLGEQVVLMPPEVLEKLRDLGCSLADIQAFLFEAEQASIPGIASLQREQPIATSASSIVPIETGGPGIKMTCLPLWAGSSISQTLPVLDLSR
jgi:hypothetical protein